MIAVSFSLFIGTFILEDVALASALALISQKQISFFNAFIACSLGIGVGDLALYCFGKFASRLPYFRKKLDSPQLKAFQTLFLQSRKMDLAIVVSRAIPGTRVPTYLIAGAVKYPFLRFTTLTLFSVVGWVFLALFCGEVFFAFFKSNWIMALISFCLGLFLTRKLFLVLADKWSRKAFVFSWRKWLHFEFWPAWFFYLPLGPMYIYLSVKHRSFWLPFYANPHLKNGGLIGESKWDLLKHLSEHSPSTLPAIQVSKSNDLLDILKRLETKSIEFPLIAKPDIGQRGFGVRIIKNREQLQDYLDLSEGPVLLQRKSQFDQEAGVFYIRHPSQVRGFIFSVTDKKFPYVVGDGRHSLGELILKDSRARIMAQTYFSRHKTLLDQIPTLGEKYLLSECGNHCQGAIFQNGHFLSTAELLESIEQIAKQIPDFYFGRLDLRYSDKHSFRRGKNFEIIEVNGAGAEATHIWDARTNLFEAYRVLFLQWSYLFSIGAEMKRQGRVCPLRPLDFLFDCAKVFFRKSPLSTSS